MYTKCIQIILKFLLLAKLKKVRHVYLRAVRSPGTKRVQFVKENHTRCRISCPLKYLPDSSLTLTYILRYNTEKDFFSRWEMCVKKKTQFRVALNLCFKASLSANLLIWTAFFILVQIKLIFTRKVLHLASSWKREFLELRNGLLRGC